MSSVPPPPPPPPPGSGSGPNRWSGNDAPSPSYGTPPTYGTPPPYGTPPGYGAPPPPAQMPWQGSPQYAATNPFDSRGTTVLVLGILSLVVCGLLGPVGWSMGSTTRKEAMAAGWPEPGNCKAGRICSIISSVLLMLVAGFIVIAIVGAAIGRSGQ